MPTDQEPPQQASRKQTRHSLSATGGREAQQCPSCEGLSSLATLLGNLPGMAYRCRENRAGSMEFVSEGSMALTGYPPADLIDNRRMSCADLIHPDDRETVLSAVRAAVRERRRYQITYRITTHRGQEKWVWEQGQGVFDVEGRLLTLEGFIIDITERIMVEEALRKSEQARAQAAKEWQQTFDAVGSSICLLDKDMRIIRCNRKTAEILGRDIRGLPGKNCWEVFHGTSCPTPGCPTKRMFTSGRHESMEIRMNNRWYLIDVDPITDGQGTIVGMVHIMTDITQRKEVMDRLQKSELMLLDSQKMAHVGSFSALHPDGPMIWSDEAYRIFERSYDLPPYSPEELLAMVHPEDREPLAAIPRQVLEEKRSAMVEYRITLPGGLTKHLKQYAEPTLDRQGSVINVSGTVIDVTPQKLAEQELQRDEDRLQLLLQLSEMTTSAEGELFSFATESIVGMTGSTGGYFHLYDEKTSTLTMSTWSAAVTSLCKTAEDTHYPLYRAGIWADSIRRRQVVIHNDYVSEQLRKGLPEGHFPLARHLGFPVFDGDRIVAVAGVANKEEPYTDSDVRQIRLFMSDMWKIIARKRSEAALAESQTRYRTLIETSIDGIFRLDAKGIIRFINPAGARMLGFDSPEELIGLPIQDFWANPADRTILVARLKREKAVHQFPFIGRKRDGTEIYLETSTIALVDAGGAVSGNEGILRDVTGHKKLQEQLLHAQKMEAIGTLAGGVAHDFNNILSAMIGYASLAQMDLPDDHPARTNLEQILSLSERAAALTHGLLALSRRQVMSLKPVNLNQIASAISRILMRLIGEQVELRLDLCPDDLVVMADAGQIEQVLMNLATNARDAMPQGGLLTISTQATANGAPQAGRSARVTVTDTGTGMPEDVRTHIFEPYFTTKETGKGTGLGLAIVYGIIDQHNGTITVESEPGKGSSFSFHLPLVQGFSENDTVRPSVEQRGGTELVLLVEDDDALRTVTCTMLKARGYRVIEAVNGADALAQFRGYADTIDLILMDLVMPKMSGRKAAEIIGQEHPGIKIIFMSGYTADNLDRKTIIEEGRHFLAKPFTPGELFRMIREVLDHA